MKKIGIRKGFSYFFTDSEAVDSGAIDEKLSALEVELAKVFERFEFTPAAGYTSFYGVEKFSIASCESCSSLMINRDKNPAVFEGTDLATDHEFVIRSGGTHNGQELCEACLPNSHRWGHHF